MAPPCLRPPGSAGIPAGILVIILALCLLGATPNAAWAQIRGSNPNLLGGTNGGTTQDTISTPYHTRQNYQWRCPRAKWRWWLDEASLKPMNWQNNQSNMQAGNDSIPDKTAGEDSTETSQPADSNNQVNAKQSTGPGQFTIQAMVPVRKPYFQPQQTSTIK